MKLRLLALLLIGVFCFSLTACESGSVQSVLDNAATEAAGEEDDEEYQLEVPDAVINISDDDDKALTGTLTEDYYINPYFGLKFNKPAGGTIMSIMDEGTDIMPFSQTYTDGIGGEHINSRNDDGSVSATIEALISNWSGKTAEELVQERIEQEKGLNESMGIDSEVTMETIRIAGEDYPAYCEVYTDEDRTTKNISLYILKGDFVCEISISADIEKFDEMAGLIEKYD